MEFDKFKLLKNEFFFKANSNKVNFEDKHDIRTRSRSHQNMKLKELKLLTQ